jgi:enoyl-CoA hydratase
MSFNTIQLQIDARVATITVNRPKALNALNQEVLKELEQAVDQIISGGEVGVAIITGTGDKAFVAGADIKEINALNEETGLSFAQKGQALFAKIEEAPIPFIAAVNGFALGGGLELAMSCDFIYAATCAKLGLPECTLGLIPGFGGTVRLARKVGPGLAKEWTMTGGMFSAKDALESGLVNKVIEPADLMKTVYKTAGTILERAPLAVTAIKNSINKTYGLPTAEAMSIEAQLFSQMIASEDSSEGTSAFIEKRKPDFKGK